MIFNLLFMIQLQSPVEASPLPKRDASGLGRAGGCQALLVCLESLSYYFIFLTHISQLVPSKPLPFK